MTARNYIEQKIIGLHSKFPHIGIRYGIDESIDAHLIELMPLEEYTNNKALDKAWFPISLEFRKIFPDQDIAFFSSDSLLTIDQVIFELNPIYRNEKEILSSLFVNVTGYENIPKGNIKERHNKDRLISNPVITPEEDLNIENSNQYSYPLAA